MSLRKLAVSALLLALVPASLAIAPPKPGRLADRVVRQDPPQPAIVSVADDGAPLAPFEAFRDEAGGTWWGRVDAGTGRAVLIAGSGIAITPVGGQLELASIEAQVRSLVARHPALLAPPLGELALSLQRSHVLDAGRVVTVDFDVVVGGRKVEGARVFARMNRGRVIQLGTELLASRAAPSEPVLDEAAAWARLFEHAGGRTELDVPFGEAELFYVPTEMGGEIAYRLVWQVAFQRRGDVETWTARVDAHDGSILAFFDQNHYEGAVDGGVFPRTVVDAEVELPFPFVNVTGAGATDSAGQFTFSGGMVSTGLDGPYFNTNCEGCVSPSQALVQTDIGLGLLRLGTGGTDHVGNGFSTPAERNSFFHLSLVRMLAKKWLAISWLDANIRSNVNIADTCNAFYNGTVNFYRSGGGCNNTGEIADVMQHEWGHGIDNNTRGGDSATGEGTADHVAFTFQRDPVIGPYFRTTGAGVRDLDRLTNSRGLLTRSNVGSKCPPAGTGCSGPLGYQCHCEGEIYGQTGWDLAQALVAKHGFQTGWLLYERIFYESLPQAGGYLPDGSGAIYDAYLAVDDDDGNLANGTPNGQEIYDAFALHEIAGDPVTSSPGCARPAEPAVVATSDCSGVTLAWDAVPGAVEYRVMKNWLGPERAFLPAGEVATTSFVDGEVRPGITYHYVVQAVDASGCGSTIENVTTIDGPQRPVLDAFQLAFDDVPAGNRSGTIDPGESVDLFITLRNVTNVAGTGLLGTLQSSTPGVTVEVAEQVYPDSLGLDTTANSAGFRIALDETVACGSWIDLSLVVADDSGCTAAAQPMRLRVGVEALRQSDGFDADQGWIYDAASSTATAGAWTRGVPDASSYQPGSDSNDDGTFAWFTAPNAGGDGSDDVDGGQVVLLSPVFDLTAYPAAQLSYQRWFGNRDLGEDAEDFFWVEASSNGGATWETVEKLDTTVSAAQWTRMSFDLASIIPITSTMRFRVRVSDGTLDGNLIEGAFDDFRITEAECDETPPCFVPPTFAGLESVIAAGECGETSLAWQEATTNCQNASISYSVYRSTTPGFEPSPDSLVATGLAGLTYDDTLLAPGAEYFYVVRADDTRSGQDANLERLSVIAPTTPDTKPPLFDGIIDVASGSGCGETVLSWSAAQETCGAPVVYRVYRSTSDAFTPGPEHLVAETTDLSLVEAGLDPNTTYHYVVRALDQNGLEDANLSRGSAEATVLAETLALEEFESGAAGWARSGTNDATSGLWELGTPAATDAQPGTCPSGTACWATGLSGPGLGDNDIDGGTTTLLSEVFSLAGAAEPAVRYKRYYSNNTGAAPGTDTWTVEISDDNGGSWATLESTQTSDEGLVFRTIEAPIAGLADATATMRLRFIASDLGDGSVVEAVVDDFEAVDLAGGCEDCGAAPAVGTILLAKDGDDVLIDWAEDPVTAARFKVYTLGGPAFADATLLGTSVSKGYRHVQGGLYGMLTSYAVSAVDACGQEGALR